MQRSKREKRMVYPYAEYCREVWYLRGGYL